MAKKIHITESQLEEIVKKINEDGVEAVNYGADNFDNMTIDRAATVAVNTKKNNQNTNVTFFGKEVGNSDSPIALSNNIKQDVQNMSNGMFEHVSKPITKKQIKEARLNKLIKESVKMLKKKNLK